MPKHYDLGDQPRVTGTFTDIDTGDPADPDVLQIRVLKPDGETEPYTIADCTSPAVGTWHFTRPGVLDQTGMWTVKWNATGVLVAAEEISWIVDCGRIN